MNKFAKLFDFEDGNQLLVTLQANDEEKPEVRLRTKVDGISIEMAPTFDDTDKGWWQAEDLFNSVDDDKANSFRQTLESIVTNGAGE